MLLALISVLAPSWEAGFVAMFASFLMHFTWSGLSAVTSEIGTSTTGTTIFIWTLPIVAIISLILAVGLWMLKGWARIGAIALSALDVVLSVLALAIGGGGVLLLGGALVSPLMNLMVVFLLLMPRNAKAFSK